MIDDRDRSRIHRYYTVEGGTHVDSLYNTYPDQIRPILPCYRDAFEVLTDWVEDRDRPPASGTIAKPESGDVVNTCSVG